tara:strand:- start:388 stop:717 length:330 start_codon:yes stop_codon:yes gene_type:complete
MQKTKFINFVDSITAIIRPIIGDSWRKRSILFLSLLFGFYFTNSLLSYLLDKSVNTIMLGIIIIIIMEISIRSLLLSSYSKFSIVLNFINNFRIGSSYALILEAFKLGS